MIKQRIILTILLLCAAGSLSVVQADTVTLRMGGYTVKGTVVMQNEDMVVVQDKRGRRFQYLMTDVESVQIDQPEAETLQEAETKAEKNAKAPKAPKQPSSDSGSKKTAFLVELAGGGSFIPNEQSGGMAGVQLLIGSRRINDRPIFIGGGVGYTGHFFSGKTYNILPIVAALRLPLLAGAHTPILGISAGYGVALSRAYLGGMHAGADVGYQYRTRTGTAIYVGLTTQFQHAEIEENISIVDNGTEYTYLDKVGRSFVTAGVKFAFQF